MVPVINKPTRTGSSRRARGEALDLACDHLMRIAKALGPDARMPSLRTLAEELGVSPGTLNLALDRLEQQRVVLRRERSGVFVAPRLGQRNVSLLCSPDFFLQSSVSPFWQLLIDHIQTVAREHDTHLTIGFSHPTLDEEPISGRIDPSPLPDYLQTEISSGNIQGVLSLGLPDATTRWIESLGIPVVAFAGAARYIVTTSRIALIEQGAAALAQAGCRRIDLWEPQVEYWADHRALTEQTLYRALRSYPEVQAQIVALPKASSPHRTPRHQTPRIETGWEYALHKFGEEGVGGERPDGILIGDDLVTLGALMAFLQRDIVAGRDVQIATYANQGSPVLLGWQQAIYRVEYDLSELVAMLYETLEALMKNGSAAASGEYVPPFHYDLPEYLNPEAISERYRLVRPHLIPPSVRKR